MRTSLVTRTSAGALTAAMAAVPAVCQAQSFQATPSVAFGTVTIDQSVANTTTVTVDSNRAIVDWTRSDLPGTTQFTFQPAGTTANFVKGSGAGAAPYAILNRIASTEASASAHVYCNFVPAWNGYFYVTVENRGDARVSYAILTN